MSTQLWLFLTVKRFQNQGARLRALLCVVSIVGFGYVPARLAIAQAQAPAPEVILVLGGSVDREYAASQLAHVHPNLDVWVSTGSREAKQVFQAENISLSRVHLDDRATDTVTNFTSVVTDFKRRGIQHVYLVTSDFHLPRAQAIAALVFGTQGITVTPISVPSTQPPESSFRIVRDAGRSLMWLFTGRTGARLRTWFQ